MKALQAPAIQILHIAADFYPSYVHVIIFLNLPQEIKLNIYALSLSACCNGQAERAMQIFKVGMKNQLANIL